MSAMDSSSTVLCGDDTFGPGVRSVDCRGGFDFTVLFEESILTILPAAIFLVLSPYRILGLSRRRLRIRQNAAHLSKLIAIGLYTILQLAILVVLAANPQTRMQTSLACGILSLVSGLSLAVLSHLEHTRSIRPSFLIQAYLTGTFLLDIARVRTQWLLRDHSAIAGPLTASLATKAVVLVLEAVEKRSLLLGLNKRPSKESTSSLASRGSFWWLNSLLLGGYHRVLAHDDLPVIHEKLHSDHLASRTQKAWDQANQTRKHALAYTCLWDLRWEVIATAVPKFLFVGLSLSQTYLIKEAVGYIQSADSDSDNTGYGLIGGFAFVYLGLAVTTGWSSQLTFRLMAMMRGQLISLIYTKMTTTPVASIDESSAMALMSTDAQRIAETFHFLVVNTAPSIVQLAIAIYLLYTQLGAVCIAPIIIAVVSMGLSTSLAGYINPRQKRWLEAIQRRINFTSEILGSMKNVKMLGLTDQMQKDIQDIRNGEMTISRDYRKLQSINVALVNIPQIFTSLFIFVAYAVVANLQGSDGMSVSQAITSLAAVTLLALPLANLLWAIPIGWSALGCFSRIQDFLIKDSRNDRRSGHGPPESQDRLSQEGDGLQLQPLTQRPGSAAPSIRLGNAEFGWSDAAFNVVKDVTAVVPGVCGLTIVVGPVGCGKSTLLKGLLGETLKLRGLVHVSAPSIAYCDQTSWLVSGTIRDNVVGYSEWNPTWYRTVIQACALDIDLEQMRKGDETLVGNKGFKLSGGQKQRISIARAIYSRKSLAILDDILSGLDGATEEHVFKHVFGRNGLFRRTSTSVVLATHSVKRLPHADLILALNHDGLVVEQGDFTRLNAPGSFINSLQVKLDKDEDTNNSPIPAGTLDSDEAHDTIPPAAAVDESRRTGDWATYKYYSRALGRWSMLLWSLVIAINAALNGMSYIWITWWARSNEDKEPPRLGYWLGIFTFLSSMEAITLVVAVAYMWLFIIPRCGSNLHYSMIRAAMSAPLSFFGDTDTGVLVNRFSQDLRLADMSLPTSLIDVALQTGSCLVAVAIAINAVAYIAAAVPFLLAVLYLVQKFYLRTSRQLRLLEIEATAPLFSHFIESLSGLVTIRAFGWTTDYINKSRQLLDASQKPYYLLLCIQRWLVLVLDLIVAGLAVVLIGLAVALRSRLDAGALGLALVNMMSLSGSLKNLVQHWTTLETSIGAIARIKSFSENTPAEGSAEENRTPDADWPSHGALNFENVFARYRDGTPPVLKDVSFSISPGQRMGILGRTGSGKSTSILALLRLLDLSSGRIVLDDVDLCTIKGSLVRERLICLTQDPFLFPASIRTNADPLGRSTDDAIAAALHKVALWDVLQSKVAGSGAEGGDACAASVSAVLDMPVDDNVLSHGQRQLFCLARAMLKQGSVLVLDEPTSSLDQETDAQVQRIIRDEFSHHTVIMIAHRLSGLLDFDRVAVLDAGRLVEFGNPAELLRDGGSWFAKLYRGSA